MALKEKLLLHTCCAPCGIAIIDELRTTWDLTVFFYNPNIYPETEYVKRKSEVVRLCTEWQVAMVDMDYDPARFSNAVRGLENEPEGGRRCPVCFALRLERTAAYAADNGFNVFATTLTMGRKKPTDIIHAVGEAMGKRWNVRFLATDWKKNKRWEKGRMMTAKRGIYRQTYCGCKFSLAESQCP